MLKNKIVNELSKNIDIYHLNIQDLTDKHIHHKNYNDGKHFHLEVVSDIFNNMSILSRHKMIYNILNKMIRNEIHALSLKTLTIQEYKINYQK